MHRWNPDLYSAAWFFATLAHDGQTYGGPEEGQQLPYINHVGEVAAEIMCALPGAPYCDGNLAVLCALLHDTVEDTDITTADIELRFGAEVAAGVAALSKDDSLPDKAAKMADSLARIQAQPEEVWMVKMADRIVNLSQPPFYWTADKAARYRVEAQQILDALGSAHPGLAERLASKIAIYEQFTEG